MSQQHVKHTSKHKTTCLMVWLQYISSSEERFHNPSITRTGDKHDHWLEALVRLLPVMRGKVEVEPVAGLGAIGDRPQHPAGQHVEEDHLPKAGHEERGIGNELDQVERPAPACDGG